jgi:hypothetical protein
VAFLFSIVTTNRRAAEMAAGQIDGGLHVVFMSLHGFMVDRRDQFRRPT